MSRYFIDVREPFEYNNGHIAGAINLPPADLLKGAPQLKDIPKDSELILYCISGSRSRTASVILAQLGYTNVINGINQDHVKAKYL